MKLKKSSKICARPLSLAIGQHTSTTRITTNIHYIEAAIAIRNRKLIKQRIFTKNKRIKQKWIRPIRRKMYKKKEN